MKTFGLSSVFRRAAQIITLLALAFAGRLTAASPNRVALFHQPSSLSSFVLDDQGRMFWWGSTYLPNGMSTLRWPVAFTNPAGVTRWVTLSAGTAHHVALGDDGEFYARGNNGDGQLGGGPGVLTGLVRVLRPAGVTWERIWSGGSFNMALSTAGDLYAWGINAAGLLGDGTETPRRSPVQVLKPAGVTRWIAASPGSWHTLALGDDGRIYGWGRNWEGQLGNGTLLNSTVPTPVPLPAGGWVKVAATGGGQFALHQSGLIYAWGYNPDGRLGLANGSSNLFQTTPALVFAPPGGGGWRDLAAGPSTLALADDHELYAWGVNYAGASGVGSTNELILTPTKIIRPPGVTEWHAFTAGVAHALAVGDDCRLYSWGENDYGALGNGTIPNQSSPTRVTNLLALCSMPDEPTAVSLSPLVGVAAENSTVSNAASALVFNLWRTGPTAGPLTVQFAISGTASNGVDYVALSNTAIIPAGRSAVEIFVQPKVDAMLEPTETVILTLLAPACAAVVPPPSGCYTLGASHTVRGEIRDGSPTNFAPILRLLSPVSGSSFRTPANITLVAEARDNDGVVATVEFFAGPTSLGVRSNTLPGTNLFTLTWSNVPPGLHQLTARATDNVNAARVSSSTFVNVWSGVSSNEPPLISVLRPVAGTRFLAPARISISAVGFAPDAPLQMMEFFSGTNLIGVQTVASLPNTFSLLWSNVPPGSFELLAKGTDAAGRSGLSLPVAVTVIQSTNRPPITLLNGGLTNRPADVVINATSGVWRVEVSTNFANWATLTTVTSINNLVSFSDEQATNCPVRFYRLRPGP